MFAAVRFGDSATCVVLPEVSVFALQADGRAVTKLVLGYQSLDVRVSFLSSLNLTKAHQCCAYSLRFFFQAEKMRGFASRKYDLPAGAGTHAFPVKRLRAQFPVITCIVAQGTKIAQNAFARRGYGMLKHN